MYVLAKEVELPNRMLQSYEAYSWAAQGAPPGYVSPTWHSYWPASLGVHAWPFRPHYGGFALFYEAGGFFGGLEDHLKITINPSSNPEFFAPGTHSMVAGAYIFPVAVGTDSTYDEQIHVFHGKADHYGKVTSSHKNLGWQQSCVYPRWPGSGSNQERYWQGSGGVNVGVKGSFDAAANGSRGYVGGFVVGMDCVEIHPHRNMQLSGVVSRHEQMALSGRPYGLTFKDRKRWKLPMQHVSTIDYLRINSWVYNGHKLVLGRVYTSVESITGGVIGHDCDWLVRVVALNRGTPLGSAVPGHICLRDGYIEVEETGA
jgi:hypothetical protein